MVAETVLIEVDADSPYDDGLATVTATFTMRNLGDGDEQMEVRFPLDQTIEWGGLCSDIPYFSTITDLKVKVNGQSVPSQKTYQTVTIPAEQEPYPTVTLPCWEHFPVSFPVGKDIIIEVSYTTEPYHDADASYAYAYILETGMGWKDTIGTADIVLQVPYELNDSNFYSCRPEDCALSGNKVQWHYENFEPTSNIGISLFPPPLLQRIVVEKENVTRNPNDGEAWGRLAKAYKESIMEKRGFRSEPAAIERYRLSLEAYQKAVTLLPNDADWHYGFAELLCWNADWNNLIGESNENMWRECVEQIRQTININPKHEKGNDLLEHIASTGMIDLSGPQPNYLILTSQPAGTATPSKTQVLPSTEMMQTATVASNNIRVTLPTVVPPAKAFTPIVQPITSSPRTSTMPLYFGIAVAILIGIVGFLKLRKG